LLAFSAKVAGKATWSRGLYISISGFSEDALAAFSRGRPANLIAMNGQDIYFILEGEMSLPQAIRLKTRRAAETGEIMVSVYQLLTEGYNEPPHRPASHLRRLPNLRPHLPEVPEPCHPGVGSGASA